MIPLPGETSRKSSLSRSTSSAQVADVMRSIKTKCQEHTPVFTHSEVSVVVEYVDLRCAEILYDIFQHSDDVLIITYKSPDTKCIFARGPVIGKGQEGIVYLAQDLTSKNIRFVALKERECSTRLSKIDCINEYKILEYLKYAEGFLRCGRFYYSFMNYIPGLNASQIPTTYPDVLKQAIACGMLRALHSLHCVGVLHGDVKTDNFIFGYNTGWISVKLVDFGQSRFMQNATNIASGAPAYQPPECRVQLAPIRTTRTEYYSLAICQLEILSCYSFQEYQAAKSVFDGYFHNDLIECCMDVFLSPDELESLKEINPWRYEILRNAYAMYTEDITNRPIESDIEACIALLDNLEGAAIKSYSRSDSNKYVPRLRRRSIEKLDLSAVYRQDSLDDTRSGSSKSVSDSSPSSTSPNKEKSSPKDYCTAPQSGLKIPKGGK